MIDFHAHVLPAADHGSDSLETSLKQLELAAQAGVQTLVATPHFYPQYDRPDEFLKRRQAAYELLCAHHTGVPQVLLGAEVQLCTGLEHLSCLRELRIAGTKTLLLELPFCNWPSGLRSTLQLLLDSRQYTPVLAHVDRYPGERIDELLAMGLLGQINADALCRLSGRRRLFSWIDNGSIVALGSDLHGTQTGYAQFQKAERVLGDRLGTLLQRTRALLDTKIN